MRDAPFNDASFGNVVVLEVEGGYGEAGEEGSSVSVGEGLICHVMLLCDVHMMCVKNIIE